MTCCIQPCNLAKLPAHYTLRYFYFIGLSLTLNTPYARERIVYYLGTCIYEVAPDGNNLAATSALPETIGLAWGRLPKSDGSYEKKLILA